MSTRLKLLLLLFENVPFRTRYGGFVENKRDFESEEKNIQNSDDYENLKGSLFTKRGEQRCYLCCCSRSLHSFFILLQFCDDYDILRVKGRFVFESAVLVAF